MKYFKFYELSMAKKAKTKKLGLLLMFTGLAIPLLTGLVSGHFDALLSSVNESHALLALGTSTAFIGCLLVFKPDMPERLRVRMDRWLNLGVYDSVRVRELSLASEVFEALMKKRR
jgi:uncharacterized membrane protein YczE